MMTAEESAFKKFQDEPFFEVLVESISTKAARYAYARIKQNMTLGAGNTIDCIIREHVFKNIERLDAGQSLKQDDSKNNV